MMLDRFLRIGETITLGSHRFTAEEIKSFAARFDPQPFHVDEEAARRSVFGALCASGWHTASMWMRYNLKEWDLFADWQEPGGKPALGPSPGFVNLKWLKPVYAGDTITFKRTMLRHRALGSRPGWRVVSMLCEAFHENGDKVLEFESSVLLDTGQAAA